MEVIELVTAFCGMLTAIVTLVLALRRRREGDVSGYDKHPDYGGKPSTWRSMVVGVCVIVLIAAGLVAWRLAA